MNLTSYGMVATSAVVTAGAIGALSTPASAHNPSIDGLAHVGSAYVRHADGFHAIGGVCNYDNIHSNRGEFKSATGDIYAITNNVPGCIDTVFPTSIAWLRACDPWGCTDWKAV